MNNFENFAAKKISNLQVWFIVGITIFKSANFQISFNQSTETYIGRFGIPSASEFKLVKSLHLLWTKNVTFFAAWFNF